MELLALEPARCAEAIGAVGDHLGAERLEREQVGIDAPAADHVAARQRHVGAAEARQQRAGEQDRGADALREPLVERRRADVGGAHADLVALRPVDLGTEVDEQLEHRLDVADARHVAEHDRLGR